MSYKDPEHQRAYARRWVADRRNEWFSNKCCVHCGSKESLQLDHIDPSQKVSHKIWSWSLGRREVEIAKCQVLCERCHKIKTLEAHVAKRKHGTMTMRNNGCHCDECRRFWTEYMREYRSKSRKL